MACCCSQYLPHGGSRAHLSRSLTLTVVAPLARKGLCCPQPQAPWAALASAGSVLVSPQESFCHPGPRDLLLLHLLQRKGQHWCAWVWGSCRHSGNRQGEGRGREALLGVLEQWLSKPFPAQLSLKTKARTFWVGQYLGNATSEHYPCYALHWFCDLRQITPFSGPHFPHYMGWTRRFPGPFCLWHPTALGFWCP